MVNWRFITELWYIKILISIVIFIFAPIQAEIFILFFMIVLDTITGVMQAVKFKRFRSCFLRETVNKISLYGLCIITVRLFEQGTIFNTTSISRVTLGFLIAIEAISILENLVLLGIPLPRDFLTALLKNVRIFGLENLVRQSIQDYSEIKEIEEMINYQVTMLKNENMRILLEIKFKIWSQAILLIKRNIGKEQINNNDILYYKIMSFIESGNKEKLKKWKDYGILDKCIEQFEKWHKPRKEKFLQSVRIICYSDHTFMEKKQELVDRIIILLYQTIIDAHKIESELCCGACKVNEY